MLAKSADFTLTAKALTLGLIVVSASILTLSFTVPVLVYADDEVSAPVEEVIVEKEPVVEAPASPELVEEVVVEVEKVEAESPELVEGVVEVEKIDPVEAEVEVVEPVEEASSTPEVVPEAVEVVEEEVEIVAPKMFAAKVVNLNMVTSTGETVDDNENSFTTSANATTATDITSNENSFTTGTNTTTQTETTSTENSFTTATTTTVNDVAVSVESSFTTTGVIPNLPVVSDEGTFTTQPLGGGSTEVVSNELSFTTLTGGCTSNCNPTGVDVISGENSFTTLAITTGTEVVSNELSFTTLTGGCTSNCNPTEPEVVSSELSFTTLPDGGCTSNCNPVGPEIISDEHNFTTLEDDDGGCQSDCDNDDDDDDDDGGGGGSHKTPPPDLPAQCFPYLLKFIKWGANNDPEEVRKLQYFLRDFEGFASLQINGIYDRPTFDAVTIFQKRYSSDVLSPWGITDSTGYVYITTTLKINYIVCGIDRPIDLDLRDRYRAAIERGGEFNPDLPPVASTTATTTTAKPSFLAAAVAFLQSLNWCYLLPLILLLIILILFLLWQEARRERDKARREKELAQALLAAVTRDHDYADGNNAAVPMSEALLSSSLFQPTLLGGEAPEELPVEMEVDPDTAVDEAAAEWQEVPELDDDLTDK